MRCDQSKASKISQQSDWLSKLEKGMDCPCSLFVHAAGISSDEEYNYSGKAMTSNFKSSKETASWLMALARIHIDEGELGKAETVYNDALLLAQKTYGIESGLTMLVLKDLKAFYLLTNQSEKLFEIENSITNHKRFIN